MFDSMNITEFLDRTASSSPVPGGGSIAALAGAAAASLTAMVANLTIGRKEFADQQEEMKAISAQAGALQEQLIKAISADARAYEAVLTAYKMSKKSDRDKEDRRQKIEAALKKAALVPLDVARAGVQIINIAEIVVKRGNANAATDGLVAVMMARTAVLGAICNVEINLTSINDAKFTNALSAEVATLKNTVVLKEREILKL